MCVLRRFGGVSGVGGIGSTIGTCRVCGVCGVFCFCDGCCPVDNILEGSRSRRTDVGGCEVDLPRSVSCFGVTLYSRDDTPARDLADILDKLLHAVSDVGRVKVCNGKCNVGCVEVVYPLTECRVCLLPCGRFRVDIVLQRRVRLLTSLYFGVQRRLRSKPVYKVCDRKTHFRAVLKREDDLFCVGVIRAANDNAFKRQVDSLRGQSRTARVKQRQCNDVSRRVDRHSKAMPVEGRNSVSACVGGSLCRRAAYILIERASSSNGNAVFKIYGVCRPPSVCVELICRRCVSDDRRTVNDVFERRFGRIGVGDDIPRRVSVGFTDDFVAAQYPFYRCRVSRADILSCLLLLYVGKVLLRKMDGVGVVAWLSRLTARDGKVEDGVVLIPRILNDGFRAGLPCDGVADRDRTRQALFSLRDGKVKHHVDIRSAVGDGRLLSCGQSGRLPHLDRCACAVLDGQHPILPPILRHAWLYPLVRLA